MSRRGRSNVHDLHSEVLPSGQIELLGLLSVPRVSGSLNFAIRPRIRLRFGGMALPPFKVEIVWETSVIN